MVCVGVAGDKLLVLAEGALWLVGLLHLHQGAIVALVQRLVETLLSVVASSVRRLAPLVGPPHDTHALVQRVLGHKGLHLHLHLLWLGLSVGCSSVGEEGLVNFK